MTRKNFIERLIMPLPELEAYYRQRRRERFEQNVPFGVGGITLRKILHPVLVCAMRIKHVLGGQKVAILGDKRVPTKGPIVYAATHIGWDDIEMILSSIDDHAYLFLGDPREMYRDINGCLLDINGVIICDTGDKFDRHIGKESCVKWLDQGGNLLIETASNPQQSWGESCTQVAINKAPE